MTIRMWDSTEIAMIPPSPEAVAGYTGGKWPTYNELVKRFPQAHHLSIAVASHEDADCLDVEPGDAPNYLAADWFKRQKARGLARPCFYTSISNVKALEAVLHHSLIDRKDYRLWAAHYTGIPHIEPGCDATQYTDKALGRNLDASLCSDSFFGDNPNYVPGDEARWEREWDALQGKNGPWAKLRRRVLKRTMLHRQRLIVKRAEVSGWDTLNRKARYHKLLLRTGAR
jgi:hypothetical protein